MLWLPTGRVTLFEIAVYPTWYDKHRAEMDIKHPWLELHFKYTYVDLSKETPIWLYPVVTGPEEYL